MSGSAIIIGHGPGVGDAAARAFAAEGRTVALLARDGARAQQAADAIGGGAIGLAVDASDEAVLVTALDEVAQRLGNPSVVLYNAAFWRPGPVLSTTVDQWLADYKLDVLGAFVAARWASQLLPRGGALLFTGGGLALHPSAQAPSLSIGKSAIRALALMLAEELSPAGIRVGTVTIAGQVGAAGLPASRVAESFVALAGGQPDRSTAEIVLRPMV
jgi:NAD(P)-dependent dehydrogenase (short-subunit alcohol dehydrogenase family)